jgi:hypothetical protein
VHVSADYAAAFIKKLGAFMRIALVAGIIGFCLTSSASLAETYSIPNNNPVATVNIPGSWKAQAYKGGVEGLSPDGRVYVAVEGIDGNNVKAATEASIKWFQNEGVQIDESSAGSKELTTPDGLKALEMTFTGTDKTGPAKIAITLITTNKPGKFIMLSYWGDEAAEKANANELKTIALSLQATK